MTYARREFLRRTLGATAVFSCGPVLPQFLERTLHAAAGGAADAPVLVVVQMAGGNDGLNTLAPYGDDRYGRNRPTIRLRENQVLKIDSGLGFAPQMKGFKRLFDEGLLTVVQGVGYPNMNRNHPAAMRVWQTAEPEPSPDAAGWVGRIVDRIYQPEVGNVPALFVGGMGLPEALRASRTSVPSVENAAQYTIEPRGARAGEPRRQLEQLAAVPRLAGADPLLKLLSRETAAAYAASQRVEEAIAQSTTRSSGRVYPRSALAQRLRDVAQLIRADLGIRVFYTEIGGNSPGGFDNHANQLANHGVLLEELSESLTAFADDLRRDRLLDRVVLMTFSEFGRTLAENGRHGTDHGSAAPMFLVGSRLRGGLVGRNPDLSDLDNGGLRSQTDFRQVYATLAERWLGIAGRSVVGESFPSLDLIKGA